MDKIKKGKKQEKKIITFNASNNDFTPDISIRVRPDRYKPIAQINRIATCFKVFVFIIVGE